MRITPKGQLIIVLCGALLAAVGYPVSQWFMGMAIDARESGTEISDSDVAAGAYSLMLFGYTMYGTVILMAVIFAFLAALNLIRFITGTGLADPNEAW